jgi:DNA-binding SARP family transcriptional activator
MSSLAAEPGNAQALTTAGKLADSRYRGQSGRGSHGSHGNDHDRELTAHVPGTGAHPPRRLSLLGGWRLECGGAVQHLPASAQRLLAFLCLNGRASRAYLAGTLWPEASEQHAHGSLRSALWRVHRSQPDLLASAGNQLALDDSVSADVRDLTDQMRRLGDGVVPSPGAAAHASLLDGELLPGWYDDWVLFERERLRQLRLHALEALALGLAATGRYGEAIEVGLAAVRVEPLRESAHRAVVRVHLAEGNVAEALRQYELCRRLFRVELGLEPSRLLTSLLPARVTAVTGR